MATYGVFGFEVGSPVQLRGGRGFYEVKWRGWLLVPTLGGRRREAVYWLGPGHWDCYWEDELVPLGQGFN